MTAYLIGGPARVGKSSLYRALRRGFDGDCVELDPVKRAAELWAHCAPDDPLLIAPRHEECPPDEWVGLLRRRDRAVWDGVLAWIVEHQRRQQDDILLNGLPWPDFVAELRDAGVEHRAVFLVDTSPRHADRVWMIARRGSDAPNNVLLTGRTHEWCETWARYNRSRSRAYAEFGADAGYPVVDMADYEHLTDPYSQMQAAGARALGFDICEPAALVSSVRRDDRDREVACPTTGHW